MLWHSISFFIHFNLAILLISLFQLLIAPTYYLYSPLYHRLITATKRAFGAVTVGISQDWAPTTFHLTQGRGPNDSTNWINLVKDHKGRATTLQLPKRAIWISNHQLLADWIYIWSLSPPLSSQAANVATGLLPTLPNCTGRFSLLSRPKLNGFPLSVGLVNSFNLSFSLVLG